MAPDFRGRAALVVRGREARLHDFTIEGNRDAWNSRSGLPPYDVPFARFTRGNGILAEGVDGLTVERVAVRGVAGFAVLASRSRHVLVDRVEVSGSGSRNSAGRNNATGGILLEEGTADFRVTNCDLRDILGNGIWTHSLYTSPRNGRGLIAGNRFDTIGRDAIQVGHAFDVRVESNVGRAIGFPADADRRHAPRPSIPPATSSAASTPATASSRSTASASTSTASTMAKCAATRAPDVAGYGIVFNNTNPDMQSRSIRVLENRLENVLYGGIFVIGTGHVVARNRLLNLNTVALRRLRLHLRRTRHAR